MTPIRALLASLFASILLGAGSFIVASFAGGRPHDIVPILTRTAEPFSLLCFLAAWGAIVGGALGVIAAFFAFIAPEEDDDPRARRRGFPKPAALVLIMLALALFHLALKCAATAPVPIAAPVEPAPVAEPMPAPEPVPTEVPAAPQEAIRPVASESGFSWPYMDPIMRASGPVWLPDAAPFGDDGENARLLCNVAWVAVTGSSSEEGPENRNMARSRARTLRAMSRAEEWLFRHTECGPTIVLGLDLGQHVAVENVRDPAASAYQRRVLTVVRSRRDGGERLSVAGARAELTTYLADPENRRRLLAGRAFPAEPQILTP